MIGSMMLPLFSLTCSTLFFALMGLSVRFSSEGGSWTAVWVRSAFGCIILLIWMLLRRKDWPRPQRPGLLLLRGCLGLISLSLYFYAITISNATDAILLTYTYPIFATLFGFIFLHEKVEWLVFPALVLLVIGLYLQADGFHGDWRAWTAGLTSAVTAGLAVTVVRVARQSENTQWVVFAFVAVAALGSSPLAVPRIPEVFQNGTLVAGLLCVGLFGTLGQLAMTWAYRRVAVSTASLISTLTIPLSLLLETLTGEPLPSVQRLLGFALVLSAVYLAFVARHKTPRAIATADLEC